MKILVIGGTRFVGRHFVDAALANGHEITLFNRGQSNADLYPNVTNIQGDRTIDADLAALKGQHWDAVVDTCGYAPSVVRKTAELLRDAVDSYLFISTISVYDGPMQRNDDENAKLQTLEDPTLEEVTNESYGGLKVLCEQVVNDIYGDRALQVRPGMIVGPYDPTDRYTYWDVRAAHGGEILAPGAPDRPVQMIDGRDLGKFMLHLLEQKTVGVFNATGQVLSWQDWMNTFSAAGGVPTGGVPPHYIWVSDDFLKDKADGGELPFWVPSPYENIFAVSVDRAVKAGLTYRPALEIARDTLAWKGTPAISELKAGMKPEREAELLAEWHQQNG
jgi:2'-hydroxyisoflavone reductase